MSNSDNERWLPIVGFEGRYLVSDFGRIRSVSPTAKRGKNGIMKSRVNDCGYIGLTITGSLNKVKCITVHRQVALAFIPNPNSLPQVNHKDGDKTNNHISNLEWSTRQDNITHAKTAGLCKNLGRHGTPRFKKNLGLINTMTTAGFTKKQIADRLGLSYNHVLLISKHQVSSHRYKTKNNAQ